MEELQIKESLLSTEKYICQIIDDNGNGDILLTGIRTGSSLYKLQMKALIQDDESSCAYQISTEKSDSHTAAASTAETNKYGERQMDTIEL